MWPVRAEASLSSFSIVLLDFDLILHNNDLQSAALFPTTDRRRDLRLTAILTIAFSSLQPEMSIVTRAASADDAGETVQESRLLDLPAELRNRIYRYTLCTDGDVDVTATGYNRPGLMACNKQLRQETLAIYYEENEFIGRVDRLNFSGLGRFVDELEPKHQHLAAISRWTFVNRTPHWPNVLRLMQAAHSGEFKMRHDRANLKRYSNAIELHLGVAVRIAISMKEAPWKVVESAMEEYRVHFIRMDKAWAQDEF